MGRFMYGVGQLLMTYAIIQAIDLAVDLVVGDADGEIVAAAEASGMMAPAAKSKTTKPSKTSHKAKTAKKTKKAKKSRRTRKAA